MPAPKNTDSASASAPKPFEELVRHYERCFEKHGNSAKGFDWPSEDYAEKTYRTMSDLVRHAQTMLGQSGTQSILDVGCGSGLLHRHLLANGFTLQYRGIDLSEKFIAKARLDYPGIPFSVCDVLNDRDLKELEPHDYIVCNGIFTQKLATSEADMRAHFESFISRLWSKCGVGLAFNAIAEDAVDWRKDNLFYLGYSSLAKFLKEKISTKYVFRKDYGLYEFTAYVFK